MKKKNYLFPVSIFIIFTIFLGCEKEKYSTNIQAISFSKDTLTFDTVFTERGTATRNFKVYNKGEKTIQIKNVYLENPNSFFRFNVDGIPGDESPSVDILAKDSAWVFVEATIDPNGQNTPLVVEDHLIFESENGDQKKILLNAWGQDAIYIFPDTNIQGLPPLKILEPNAIWTAEKPIVVFGFAVVDSSNSLRINAGTKVHFHDGAGLWVYRGGKITATGTPQEPIIFQGDRLEAEYQNLPGQWDRIWINEGSSTNFLSNIIVKNSVVGLQIETLPFNETPPNSSDNRVIMQNCAILNSSLFGLFLRNFRVAAENILVANSGNYSIGISGGGEYTFKHVTVANYWNHSVRQTPSVYFTNAYEDAFGKTIIGQLTFAGFTNSIIYGNNQTELDWDLVVDEQGQINNSISFENCLIRRKEITSNSDFSNIIWNENPDFYSFQNQNFSLQKESPAIDQGIVTNVNDDILGFPRNDGKPDLGAFEFNPTHGE